MVTYFDSIRWIGCDEKPVRIELPGCGTEPALSGFGTVEEEHGWITSASSYFIRALQDALYLCFASTHYRMLDGGNHLPLATSDANTKTQRRRHLEEHVVHQLMSWLKLYLTARAERPTVQRIPRNRDLSTFIVNRLVYSSSPLWSTSTTASMTCLSIPPCSTPACVAMSSWLAVNNFPGRA
jgi:hypothetical protein